MRRGAISPIHDKSWLSKHYVDLKEDMHQIAKTCGCSDSTVHWWLRRFGIKTRNRSEAKRLKSNRVRMTKELTEFLVGLLLGDGHVHFRGWTGQYAHSSSIKSFLEWLASQFQGYGVVQSGRIRRRESWHTFPGCGKRLRHDITFSYFSRLYVELGQLHVHWYRKAREDEKYKTGKQKRYIKILPVNLELTPLTCLMWYLGDGSLDKDCGYVTMCTQGFRKTEVVRLAKILTKLGFITKRQKDNSIRISQRSVPDFLDYIGPCPIKCYEYKWNLIKKEVKYGKRKRVK